MQQHPYPGMHPTQAAWLEALCPFGYSVTGRAPFLAKSWSNWHDYRTKSICTYAQSGGVMMELKCQKILCPVDFDDNSLAALDSAAEIAGKNAGTVFLLHVIPMVVQPMGMPPEVGLYDEQEKVARARLSEIEHERLAGVSHESMTCVGDPAPSILKMQRKLGADLIVIGTHGRRGLSRLFLGSVAEHVIREAPCPVLTIRNHAPETAEAVA